MENFYKQIIKEEIYFSSKRISEFGNYQPLNKMFDKTFREGGRVEYGLSIYASEAALEEEKLLGNLSLSKQNLLEKCNDGVWWESKSRMSKLFKKKKRWEHIVPVKTCIKQCIYSFENKSQPDFKVWLDKSLKNNWSICWVTLDEDDALKKQKNNRESIDANHFEIYQQSKIKLIKIRNSLF